MIAASAGQARNAVTLKHKLIDMRQLCLNVAGAELHAKWAGCWQLQNQRSRRHKCDDMRAQKIFQQKNIKYLFMI